jgi:hypothetical protein
MLMMVPESRVVADTADELLWSVVVLGRRRGLERYRPPPLGHRLDGCTPPEWLRSDAIAKRRHGLVASSGQNLHVQR